MNILINLRIMKSKLLSITIFFYRSRELIFFLCFSIDNLILCTGSNHNKTTTIFFEWIYLMNCCVDLSKLPLINKHIISRTFLLNKNINTHQKNFNGAYQIHGYRNGDSKIEEHSNRTSELWSQRAGNHEVGSPSRHFSISSNSTHR